MFINMQIALNPDFKTSPGQAHPSSSARPPTPPPLHPPPLPAALHLASGVLGRILYNLPPFPPAPGSGPCSSTKVSGTKEEVPRTELGCTCTEGGGASSIAGTKARVQGWAVWPKERSLMRPVRQAPGPVPPRRSQMSPSGSGKTALRVSLAQELPPQRACARQAPSVFENKNLVPVKMLRPRGPSEKPGFQAGNLGLLLPRS